MSSIYLISLLRNDTQKRKVLAVDDASGGYYYWDNNIQNGKQFKSIEECRTIITSPNFTKNVKMTSGAIYPPSLIHSGLGLCNDNPQNSGVIEIAELSIKVLHEFKISAKIPQ